MDIIIGIVTAVFLIFIGVIIRQASRIGTLESSLKNEDKNINDMRAEIVVINKKHNESVSSLSEIHRVEVERLNVKNEKLKSKSHNKKPLNYPKSNTV
jgi:type VI protein secretion system component VasK